MNICWIHWQSLQMVRSLVWSFNASRKVKLQVTQCLPLLFNKKLTLNAYLQFAGANNNLHLADVLSSLALGNASAH